MYKTLFVFISPLEKKQKRRVDDFAEDNDIIELRKLIEFVK